MHNSRLLLKCLLCKNLFTLLLIILLSSCASRESVLIHNLKKESLNNNDSYAKVELVRIYSEGKIVPKNISESSKWIKILADDGHIVYLKKLAYEEKIGSVEVREIALKYINILHQYYVSFYNLNKLRSSVIDAEYKPSLTIKHKDLDDLYAVILKDLESLASQEYMPAQHSLGYLYYSGFGMPKDYKKALYWTEKAAKNCYYFNYGIHGLLLDLYFSGGFGIEKNITKAYEEFFLLAYESLYKSSSDFWRWTGEYELVKTLPRNIKTLPKEKLNEIIAYIIEIISDPNYGIDHENAAKVIISALRKAEVLP